MKKILSLLLILFTMPSFASMPDIIALVNDQPITKYDFQTRKKMVMILNNIEISNDLMESRLNNQILNLLIEEELLNQHSDKVGGAIAQKDIDNSIHTIEKRNNMPKGALEKYFKEKNVNIQSFRNQVKNELIKANIIQSLSRSVSLSQDELESEINSNIAQDFDVEAWIFTSKTSTDKDLRNMQTLKKKLISCNKLDDKLYKNFADAEKLDRKLKESPNNIQSIILDTEVKSASSIYKENNKFKLIFVCKKDNLISEDNLLRFKTLLSNKKMSQKAKKFFSDLRAKAYIKIMIPNSL